MRDIANMYGFKTTIVADKSPVDIEVGYDGTTLSMDIARCNLSLATVAKERFNNLNIVLPEKSSDISIVEFRGSITKSGNDRIIDFSGGIGNISIPLPVLKDIRIDKALFHYKYTNVAPVSGKPTDLSGQVIFIGCKTSVTGALAKAMPGATFTGAYFLSDDASLVYFDFVGTIKVGEVINLIFGVTPTDLTLDVQSAGVFRIAKKDAITVKGTGEQKDTTIPGITYADALQQIISLQGSTAPPDSGTREDPGTKDLMPVNFPLTQVGSDFATQFNEAFNADDVTGICFWAEIDFSKISLFDSLITIGYTNEHVNRLILYGFRTEKAAPPKQDQHEQQDQPTQSNSAFFVQLPTIKLFNILTFGGNHGRKGILFQYTSNKEQYELSGSIAFDPFPTDVQPPKPPPLLFDGDLIVNKEKLTATLYVSTGSPAKNIDIDKRLGMTGVNLAELFFSIDKTFAQPDAKPHPIPESMDLTIGGFVNYSFDDGTKVRLSGNIVFESAKKSTEARLVLVSLHASPGLTLNDFVRQVIKKHWDWVDDVSKQFAFLSGNMYYLKCPASKSADECESYTFSYTDPIALKHYEENGGEEPTPATFKPGYHLVDATLQIFEEYDFLIDLDVESNGIIFSGTYVNPKSNPENTVKIYFIELQSPTLSVKTTIDPTEFGVSADNVTLFGTDIGRISAAYGVDDDGKGKFTGTYSHSSPDFSLEWKWTKGSFDLTKIDGLGMREVDALEQFASKLDSFEMGGGGCKKITSDLFNNLFKSSFSPSLNGIPSDAGNQCMKVPLKITYSLQAGDTPIKKAVEETGFPGIFGSGPGPSYDIDFEVEFKIPTSVKDLPDAIWDTITDQKNLEFIVGEILKDPDTYKAIAVELAKKGAASLAARMLCKAAEKEAEELAKKLAEELAKKAIKAAVGELLELSGVVVGVMAVSIKDAVDDLLDLLKKLWDAIKSLFGGGDDDQEKAQNKLDKVKALVEPLVKSVTDRLNEVKNTIHIQSLKVGLDDRANFNTNWILADNHPLGLNANLEYQLVFLHGKPGGENHDRETDLSNIGFKLMTGTSFSIPWSSLITRAPSYQMNASIQTRITGYTFITDDAAKNLLDTVHTLTDIGDHLDGAKGFATVLRSFVHRMKDYNENGLTSNVVYATLADTDFIIGKSLLGLNTTIRNKN